MVSTAEFLLDSFFDPKQQDIQTGAKIIFAEGLRSFMTRLHVHLSRDRVEADQKQFF